MQTTDLAELLAALSHPARLKIVMHLAERDVCACGDVVETMPLAQSTVSQHLKVLLEAGLVSHERAAQRSHYRLNRVALRNVSGELNALVDACCPDGCCGSAKPALD
jgi:DNA-binding transcriptional ArsR family regulator